MILNHRCYLQNILVYQTLSYANIWEVYYVTWFFQFLKPFPTGVCMFFWKITSPLQLNSCNSNSGNSKNNLNRTNSSVLPEFTSKPSKPLQEKSFNSNSHNSKNHLNRTNFWAPWTYFSSCNSNFGFGV